MLQTPAWLEDPEAAIDRIPLPGWITSDDPAINSETIPIPKAPKLVKLRIEVIEALLPFLTPSRYKIAYGGRGSSKSWGVSRMLIARAYSKYEKILCCREFQGSIGESVHALLEDQIRRMGLTSAFEIQKQRITCLTTGAVFLFEGLHANVTKIKSMEGITIVWAEEAEKISKTSWDVLTPTIRADNSEIWVTFNPDDDLDETYTRFVEDPPDNCISVQVNYHLNPWFPPVLEVEKNQLKKKDYEEYEHIWLGKPRTAIKGAYYSEQIKAIIEEKRFRDVPHDPDYPVITSWDLGMADSTLIWFYQVIGSEIRVIDLLEFTGTGMAEMILEVEKKPYKYSQHIGPHDLAVRELMGEGKSRLQMCADLGMDFTVAPKLTINDGIMAVKSVLPRCYFDKTKCAQGLKALKRYKTEYNEERKVFSRAPLHDWTSHYADSFRYFAVTPHETGFSQWGSGSIEYKDQNNRHM